jgi:predicted ATPase/DNA-binding CsgD family transcriptional regulator
VVQIRDHAVVAQHNLRPQPSPLVGRAAALLGLRERVVDEEVRLLTLTGTAGTGKTRLATALGEALLDAFEDGVWFVDLAPIDDPARVVPAIGRALGLRHQAGEHMGIDSLLSFLRAKRLLLVLDNLEHVLDAASDVGRLLDLCPQLQVVATSREPLRLRWERLYPVPPLRVPAAETLDPVDLIEVPAIQLFVQRARQVQPDFDLTSANGAVVAELCRRLDGLPLAIELAAARSRALPPQAILARLEDRLDLLVGGRRDEPLRHQTVRAALAWSHDLLTPAEQVLLRRLAVFVDGCTLDAVQSVCMLPGEPRVPALDGLESLLDKSLLKQDQVAGEPRFAMLETVRAYAHEMLEVSGEAAAVRDKHASYFAELAEAAARMLQGPHQMDWLARLDVEFANVREVVQRAIRRPESIEFGLRCASALWWYMHARGLYAEFRSLLAPLLANPAAEALPTLRGRTTRALGVADWGLGDYPRAMAEHQAALAILQPAGDPAAVCQTLIDIGVVAFSQADARVAADAFDQALRLARELGDDWMAAWALTFQGLLALNAADLGTAAARFEAALELRRGLGDLFGMAWAHNGLASVAQLRGDAAAAAPLYERALTMFRALGERPTIASMLDGLGDIALARGDVELARARFTETLALYREMDSQRGIGMTLERFAALAAAEGQFERALRLAGAAATLQGSIGGAIDFGAQARPTAWQAVARAQLGEVGADAAYVRGQTMPLDAALADAVAATGRAPQRARGTSDSPLTARELEVASLVARGSSNREIAAALVIGERTAESHVSNILVKLGLKTRVQLAAWAVARGIADGQIC